MLAFNLLLYKRSINYKYMLVIIYIILSRGRINVIREVLHLPMKNKHYMSIEYLFNLMNILASRNENTEQFFENKYF